MIEFNLLKPKISPKRLDWKSLTGLLPLIIGILTFSILCYWYVTLQKEVENQREIASRLRKEALELDRMEALIIQKHGRGCELQSTTTFLEKLVQNRSAPVKILNVISESLAAGNELALTRLSQAEGHVHVTGEALRLAAVKHLLQSLDSSGLFESVALKRLERDQRLLYFQILCVLNL